MNLCAAAAGDDDDDDDDDDDIVIRFVPFYAGRGSTCNQRYAVY